MPENVTLKRQVIYIYLHNLCSMQQRIRVSEKGLVVTVSTLQSVSNYSVSDK